MLRKSGAPAIARQLPANHESLASVVRQVLTNYEASGTAPVSVVVTIARTLDQALTIQRTLDWPSRLDRTIKAKKD